MEKRLIISVQALPKRADSLGGSDGYLVPVFSQKTTFFSLSFDSENGLMVPTRQKPGRRAFLDGNLARRKLLLLPHEYCIWDSEPAGFGLRVRPSGRYFWFVRVRHRGKQRRVSLGCTEDVDAVLARTQARRLLKEVTLDGLPKRTVIKATPTMVDFVDTYWGDIARIWKASTTKRNYTAWRRGTRADRHTATPSQHFLAFLERALPQAAEERHPLLVRNTRQGRIAEGAHP